MSDDDNYSWLNEHSNDPREGGGNPEPPPLGATPPIPGAAAPPFEAAAYEPPPVEPAAYEPPPVASSAAPPLPPSIAGSQPSMSAPTSIPTPPKKPFPLGTVLKIGGAIAVVAFIFFAGRGTTSARSLDVGDCFESPEGIEISSVDDQDCAGPHDAEVYGEVKGPQLTAEDGCIEAFIALGPDAILALPDDADFYLLSDDDDHLCVVESPSGSLVGSVVDG